MTVLGAPRDAPQTRAVTMTDPAGERTIVGRRPEPAPGRRRSAALGRAGGASTASTSPASTRARSSWPGRRRCWSSPPGASRAWSRAACAPDVLIGSRTDPGEQFDLSRLAVQPDHVVVTDGRRGGTGYEAGRAARAGRRHLRRRRHLRGGRHVRPGGRLAARAGAAVRRRAGRRGGHLEGRVSPPRRGARLVVFPPVKRALTAARRRAGDGRPGVGMRQRDRRREPLGRRSGERPEEVPGDLRRVPHAGRRRRRRGRSARISTPRTQQPADEGCDRTSFEALVRQQIELGSPDAQPAMPAELLTGKDAEDVAAYVAAVAANCRTQLTTGG